MKGPLWGLGVGAGTGAAVALVLFAACSAVTGLIDAEATALIGGGMACAGSVVGAIVGAVVAGIGGGGKLPSA